MPATRATIDGNEAVARVAYKTNEVCIIYPITPASPMGEHADQSSEIFDRRYIGTAMGAFDSIIDLSLFIGPLLAKNTRTRMAI